MGICGSNDPECAAWWVGQARRYEVDPDIAGIGVSEHVSADQPLE